MYTHLERSAYRVDQASFHCSLSALEAGTIYAMSAKFFRIVATSCNLDTVAANAEG